MSGAAVDVSSNPAAAAEPLDLAPGSPHDGDAPPAQERPAEQAGAEVGANEDRQKDPKKLNALQLFAKQSAERKAAKLAAAQGEKTAAEKPASKPDKGAEEPAAAKPKADAKDAAEGPERDATGRFVPKDKAADAAAAKPDEKAPAAGKDKPKDAPADKGKDEPPPAAAKDAKPSEAKPPEVKPEPPKEPTKAEAHERRIAELLLEKKRWEAEKLEHKRTSEKSVGETKAKLERLEQLEKLVARARGDELDDDILEPLLGRGFVDLVKAVNAGKERGGIAYKARPQLPPEMQAVAKSLDERLAKIEAREREQAEREQAAVKARTEAEAKAKRDAETKAMHDSDAERCKSWLTDKSDKYPYLTSLQDAAEQLRDTLYAAMRDAKGELTGPEPDPSEIAEMVEQSLSERLGTVFSSEYALKRALRDPKTRDLVSRLLSTNQTQETSSPHRESKGEPKATGAAEGPPTLSSRITQEATVAAEAPDEFEDPEGYKAWWRDNFRRKNRDRNAALDSIRSRNQRAEQ